MATNVSLFIGCLNDIYYPQVGVAVTKIIEHFGCRIDFPEAQTCCGAAMYQDGYAESAKDIARRFVGIFRDSEFIVTPSPRCCAMVREEYTRLLVDDAEWEEPMWQVAGRTYEFIEFLTTVLKADVSKLAMPMPIAVTYQPACQLRSMSVGDDTPRVLRRIKQLDFRTLPDAERCCGAGGGLPGRQSQISGELRDHKIAALRDSGAAACVCNEALCAMRLGNGNVPVTHIAILIADALGLDTEKF